MPGAAVLLSQTYFVSPFADTTPLVKGLIVALWLFFDRTLQGKALRATAVNRLGARLMGISSQTAGQLTLAMAALIGALSGLLIGPTTTVFTTAWQDHFVVKKAASSASLGVSTLGSISLPLNATDDALVEAVDRRVRARLEGAALRIASPSP